MQNWIIEQKEEGGIIRHYALPRFSAKWTTGGKTEELSFIEGPYFTDEGSGEEDNIHIYGFHWVSQPPTQTQFDKLMKKAIWQIDNFISRNL